MPTVDELVAAYGSRYDEIARRVVLAVTRYWDLYGGPDDADLVRWLDAVLPIVDASQRAVSELVDAYLATVLTEMTGVPIDPVGIDPARTTGAAVRNGVSPAEVYKRAVVEMRTALGEGKDYAEAKQQALNRATSTAQTDVALAHRAAAREGMVAQRVVGYRRVVTGKSCVLCAIASTQRYRRSDLMPIHSHCDCRVVPIVGDRDPGRVINRDLLRELKKSGASQDLSLQQAVSRRRASVKLNRERAEEARKEWATETDPERRQRLLERAKGWEARAAKQEQAAAHWQRKLEEFRGEHGGAIRAVEVNEHGELGPVLGDSSHHFTAEDDLDG